MKKTSKLGLACSLVCAAGSFWFALRELFAGDESVPVPRRVIRVLGWFASCAVWTANVAARLWEVNNENTADAGDIELLEEDIFDE